MNPVTLIHPEAADRFWPKVSKSDGCWLWSGWLNEHGYGMLSLPTRTGQRNWRAHRLSWLLTYGDIPAGQLVLHRCDVPRCVRPTHLFLGTQADNMADMTAKGRRAQPTRRGTHNGRAKIDADMALRIRRAYLTGDWTNKALAERLGVSVHIVKHITSGRHWAHVAA